MLGGVLGMLGGMDVVSVGCVSVVGGFLVIAGFMMLGCLAMMACRMLMMLGGELVMVSCFV